MQQRRLDALEPKFDAVMNFGSFQDELVLLGRLRPGALGYATAVHPLLQNFDQLGFGRGFVRSISQIRKGRVFAASRGAKYSWTVFKTDPGALKTLAGFLASGNLSLPVGAVVPVSQAIAAFDHVLNQKNGRAVIIMKGVPC